MVRIASILSGGLVIVLVTLGISIPVAIVANTDNARQAQLKVLEVQKQVQLIKSQEEYIKGCEGLSAVTGSPVQSWPVSDRGECLTRTPILVGEGQPAA